MSGADMIDGGGVLIPRQQNILSSAGHCGHSSCGSEMVMGSIGTSTGATMISVCQLGGRAWG